MRQISESYLIRNLCDGESDGLTDCLTERLTK